MIITVKPPTFIELYNYDEFASTLNSTSGGSSVGRASAFQAECREFESRPPLQT